MLPTSPQPSEPELSNNPIDPCQHLQACQNLTACEPKVEQVFASPKIPSPKVPGAIVPEAPVRCGASLGRPLGKNMAQ